MNIRLFQQDLNNGMTITEALQKHKITLDKAFHICKNTNNNPKRRYQRVQATGEKYISMNQHGYLLRKTIDGDTKYMGRYDTLEDARKVRDYCEVYGWHTRRLDYICECVGVERVKRKRGCKGEFVRV